MIILSSLPWQAISNNFIDFKQTLSLFELEIFRKYCSVQVSI